ncbi:Parkinson disease protein 7 homolog [Onthophagus taurus]|uniref:Parkinson disease protein 7 homolog n=1 Tax=Onthophagus taurus TaxID=166361 RepID=UPI000C20EBA0|nr:protein/nucleic acid deglycase DJ-1-like [Onthophagus taurus]
MAKKALVLMYPQNEENEIIIPVSVLRRANYEVIIASKTKDPVIGSRGMYIVPETTLKEAMHRGPYDVIVVGGGRNGWRSLTDDPDVGKILREQENCGRLIASICTGAIALKNHRIMYGRKITSYPAKVVEDMVREGDNYIYKYDDVVKDGNFISSRGNYTSWHFALSIVEYLSGRPLAEEVAQEMITAY